MDAQFFNQKCLVYNNKLGARTCRYLEYKIFWSKQVNPSKSVCWRWHKTIRGHTQSCTWDMSQLVKQVTMDSRTPLNNLWVMRSVKFYQYHTIRPHMYGPQNVYHAHVPSALRSFTQMDGFATKKHSSILDPWVAGDYQARVYRRRDSSTNRAKEIFNALGADVDALENFTTILGPSACNPALHTRW